MCRCWCFISYIAPPRGSREKFDSDRCDINRERKSKYRYQYRTWKRGTAPSLVLKVQDGNCMFVVCSVCVLSSVLAAVWVRLCPLRAGWFPVGIWTAPAPAQAATPDRGVFHAHTYLVFYYDNSQTHTFKHTFSLSSDRPQCVTARPKCAMYTGGCCHGDSAQRPVGMASSRARLSVSIAITTRRSLTCTAPGNAVRSPGNTAMSRPAAVRLYSLTLLHAPSLFVLILQFIHFQKTEQCTTEQFTGSREL